MLSNKPFSHFFYIRNASGVIAPDETPACVLIRGGVDTVAAVTVVGTADGGWVASGLIPANWSAGEYVHLRVSAIASGYPMTDTVSLGTIEMSTAEIVSAVDANSARLAEIASGVDTLPTLTEIEASDILAKEATARAAKNAAIANL